VALSLSIAIAGLTLSAVAYAQDPTSPYTDTQPTIPPTTPNPPTATEEPTTDTLPPPPTATTDPTTTNDQTAPTPAPVADTAATPNTPPKRLAFTGYDPLIVGLAGVVLMLGAVALQRRRGTD